MALLESLFQVPHVRQQFVDLPLGILGALPGLLRGPRRPGRGGYRPLLGLPQLRLTLLRSPGSQGLLQLLHLPLNQQKLAARLVALGAQRFDLLLVVQSDSLNRSRGDLRAGGNGAGRLRVRAAGVAGAAAVWSGLPRSRRRSTLRPGERRVLRLAGETGQAGRRRARSGCRSQPNHTNQPEDRGRRPRNERKNPGDRRQPLRYPAAGKGVLRLLIQPGGVRGEAALPLLRLGRHRAGDLAPQGVEEGIVQGRANRSRGLCRGNGGIKRLAESRLLRRTEAA